MTDTKPEAATANCCRRLWAYREGLFFLNSFSPKNQNAVLILWRGKR
ncbi:MAG: hypothetical protein ACI3XR_02300 [Eubacteriales bacterium]